MRCEWNCWTNARNSERSASFTWKTTGIQTYSTYCKEDTHLEPLLKFQLPIFLSVFHGNWIEVVCREINNPMWHTYFITGSHPHMYTQTRSKYKSLSVHLCKCEHAHWTYRQMTVRQTNLRAHAYTLWYAYAQLMLIRTLWFWCL